MMLMAGDVMAKHACRYYLLSTDTTIVKGTTVPGDEE